MSEHQDASTIGRSIEFIRFLLRQSMKIPWRMIVLLNLLFFFAYCTAGMDIAITKDLDLNLTIGNYTEYTITSCKMRCARHADSASIAVKDLPNAGQRPFLWYLLPKSTDDNENKTFGMKVESKKMIVVDKVQKFEDDQKSNQSQHQGWSITVHQPTLK